MAEPARGMGVIPWIIGALVVIAVLYFAGWLPGMGHSTKPAAVTAPPPAATTPAPPPAAAPAPPPAASPVPPPPISPPPAPAQPPKP
ncbi:MAG: hypothetical protein IPL88_17075 [Rhizobiales bacterium]|nr:hypothetical protein [Hyphomicrobiales bacterium]